MTLPSDIYVLVSFLNMKLRDYYKNLDELCDDLDIDKEVLIKKLDSHGFYYNESNNQIKE